jgi:hypothetical protein
VEPTHGTILDNGRCDTRGSCNQTADVDIWCFCRLWRNIGAERVGIVLWKGTGATQQPSQPNETSYSHTVRFSLSSRAPKREWRVEDSILAAGRRRSSVLTVTSPLVVTRKGRTVTSALPACPWRAHDWRRMGKAPLPVSGQMGNCAL